jgi:hypothetical protein
MDRPRMTIVMGSVEELDAQRNREWRERTPQERLDLFIELLRIWKPNAPGLSRTFAITTVPER